MTTANTATNWTANQVETPFGASAGDGLPALMRQAKGENDMAIKDRYQIIVDGKELVDTQAKKKTAILEAHVYFEEYEYDRVEVYDNMASRGRERTILVLE